MDLFLEIIIIKTLGLSILLFFVLTLRQYILKRSNATLAYQLWIIIPLFLLLPVFTFNSEAINHQLFFYHQSESISQQVISALNQSPSYFSSIIIAIWLSGFIFAFAKIILGYQKIINSFKQSKYLVPVDIEKKINLVESDQVNTVAVMGFFKTYLILPNEFNEKTLETQKIILKHELIHIKRNDQLINHLRNLIKCIFWFNPLVYWADKYFEIDQETSCDLIVLETNQDISLKEYGQVLFIESAYHKNHALLNQWNYLSITKERIKMIGKNKKSNWHKWVAGSIAALTLAYTNLIIAENIAETDAKPVVIIQPNYPIYAAKNNLEGYVQFSFDLSKSGEPINIKIKKAEPEGLFEIEAEKAFKKWRFNPYADSGSANLSYTLEFSLAENSLN